MGLRSKLSGGTLPTLSWGRFVWYVSSQVAVRSRTWASELKSQASFVAIDAVEAPDEGVLSAPGPTSCPQNPTMIPSRAPIGGE